MNYELAKELRGSGFPQIQRDGGLWLSPDGRREYVDKGIEKLKPATSELKWVYSPTLSELIEACGNEFSLRGGADGWNATNARDSFAQFFGDGSTPEEAVARLWLALNKKP